jgi:signal transduction histidine kinase
MDIPEREPARQRMEAALDRADEVMAEGRDRVVSLHPCFDKFGDLAQSLARAGAEIVNGSEVKVSVTTEGQVQTLDPVALDEIYCIGREAMVNAFRHAQGRSIEVEVDYASGNCAFGLATTGGALTRTFSKPAGPDTLAWLPCASARRESEASWISSAGRARARKLN